VKKEFCFMVLVLALLTGNISCGNKVEAKKEENAEVQTYKVSSQEIEKFIEATGSIQVDIEGGAKIISPLGGVVSKIFTKVGNRVNKGMHLLAIRSPDASDTYASYLANLSQLRQAERIYNLNKELYKVGAVTANDFAASEAVYEQLKAEGEGYKKKLSMYGMNLTNGGDSFKDRLVLKAPLDGIVVDIQTHMGDRVDTSTPLMIVADPGKILAVANIYDTDIPKIKKGNEVTFYTDVFPDVEFKGIVTYMSDIEDTDSKTVKTYIKVSNDKNLFKLNMFLKIKITDGKILCPVVPKSALLYKDGEFYAYVKENEGYKFKMVKPVREVTERLMAVEGLTDSDEVVLSAIDMEKP